MLRTGVMSVSANKSFFLQSIGTEKNLFANAFTTQLHYSTAKADSILHFIVRYFYIVLDVSRSCLSNVKDETT